MRVAASICKLCVEVVCVGLQLLVGCACRLLQLMVKSFRPGSIGRLMRRFCMLSSCSAYLASLNRVCFFCRTVFLIWVWRICATTKLSDPKPLH